MTVVPGLRLRSLRSRIMAWYGALIALCLIAYSIAVGYSYAKHVDAEWNRSAHEDVELAIRAIAVDNKGVPSWPTGFLRNQVSEEEGGGHWIEIWNQRGERLLFAGTANPSIPSAPEPSTVDGPARTLELPAGPFRVLSQTFRAGESAFIVRAAISERAGRQEILSLWRQLIVLSITVLALGFLGSYFLVRRSLGPLRRMADHASRMTADRLHDRLTLEDAGTELNQLRDAFNATLARLEASFDRLVRFTADASHELRTPLTALRSVGEVSLRQARSNAEYRDVVGLMLEEADRLSRLVDDLLTLARSDGRDSAGTIEQVDLSSITREVVDQLSVLAEEREQTIETRADQPVIVPGDRVALRRAVMNLVDNAIKYAPEGTVVRAVVGAGAGNAFVEVKDEGPGIAPPHRSHIFERFYRGDPTQPRAARGTGLGLSIVKETAEEHGGWIELDTELGRGSTFRIVLPREAKGRLVIDRP